MLWVPQKGILRLEHNLGNVGTQTPGTSVTTGGAAGTKGTPAEMIAATAFDAYWVSIFASNYGALATDAKGAMDILIGAATEEVLIADLLMGRCGGGSAAGAGAKRWDFPLYIPAGSRLAAQACGDRTSTAFRVGICLYGGHGYPPFRVGGKVTTYGIGALPAGTVVTAGASGAEGSWTQITASTSLDHFAFVPSFQPGADTTLTPQKHFFADLGVGAATEESMLGVEQSFIFQYDTNELCSGPWQSIPVFQDVPSGTRLVARLSASGAADAAQPEMAIHAVS
jgi:hypothetical protein